MAETSHSVAMLVDGNKPNYFGQRFWCVVMVYEVSEFKKMHISGNMIIETLFVMWKTFGSMLMSFL